MTQRGASYPGIVVALMAVALLAWLGYTKLFQSQEPGQASRPGGAIAVHVSPVRIDTIRDLRAFSGSLIPRAQFIVAPKIAGRLECLHVDVGDQVRRDQIVARLDDAEHVQQVEQAKAELEVARAQVQEARSDLNIAEKEYLRIESLHAQMVTSQAELDLAHSKYLAQQARLKVAESQVDQRKAALRAAEVRLGYTQVRAT